MSPHQQAEPERYRNAWAALVQLVRDGNSWSGRERNRFFLNRGGAFSDVSAISGLDHDGDGRALAILDWDRDGDLDLIYRNRTAPRLQLMLNSHAADGTQALDFVALKLTGTASNRDAIGAVVEVIPKPKTDQRLVKSVRAGDLFLSQSSRWLHFGLGKAESIEEIRVLWPGKSRWEAFSGVQPGTRYLLREGTGAAAPAGPSDQPLPAPTAKPPVAKTRSHQASIILPARIPLPPLGYRNASGQPKMLAKSAGGKPRLLVLWSATCPHCRRELSALTAAAEQLRGAGLEIIALSVDGGGDALGDAYNLIDSLKWPFAWGMIEEDALARLDEFQRALFDITVPPAVPLSLLTDRDGNVMAIYRGGTPIDELVEDVHATMGADATKLHALAPPLAGRWFTNPVHPVYAVEFMARQFEARLPEDSLFYLNAARERASGERQATLARELAGKHHRLGRQYKEARNPNLAAAHFETALGLAPSAACYLDYGTMAASYGNLQEARTLLQQALALEPNLQPAREALDLVEKLIAEGK